MFLVSVPAAGAIQNLVITQPSANETLLAEERDFYVYGIFTGSVADPGDFRIEVYPGDAVSGTPVRVIQSQVDPVSGITNASVINQTYCTVTGYCTRNNSAMVPDLVESPGGILDTTNKLVVTNRYYLGMIQGGVTKGFDTNYTGQHRYHAHRPDRGQLYDQGNRALRDVCRAGGEQDRSRSGSRMQSSGTFRPTRTRMPSPSTG